MGAQGLSKIARVAIKLLQAILAAVPLLLSFVLNRKALQESAGFSEPLVTKVFGVVVTTVMSYVICAMLVGVLIILLKVLLLPWVIVQDVILFFGGKTDSSGYAAATKKDDSSFDEEEWKSRYDQDRNQW